MAKFFIERPIFAFVIALFIAFLGAISITRLPLTQYPPVAPPSISVSVRYPGASAQVVDQNVVAVIEAELSGSPGLVYMESTSQSDGSGNITISYEPGTKADLAQVDVQNRIARAASRLPAVVTQLGVRVSKTGSSFLMFATLSSDSASINAVTLGDYAARNIISELQRVPGVGEVQLYGTEHAMRVWVDPTKLVGYRLALDSVSAAIRRQNRPISAGSIGDLPNVPGEDVSANVVTQGQLQSPEQFGDIVLRANPDGSSVHLKDVARVELGAKDYSNRAYLDGHPATGIGVLLASGANALATSAAVRAKMEELQRHFPTGVRYSVPYDTSRFVQISIEHVVETLGESIVLVFVVMFLFLQDWRTTVIPTIVVPVSLLGTSSVMLAMGFSINVLTLFGMVMVIGIVVDDAIVVVENVERIMSEEGLDAKSATRRAMAQIQSAIVGITVVLTAVFVPLAFFAGGVGSIYRQFCVVMVAAIVFSAFLALSLTPALCGSLLVPRSHGSSKRVPWLERFNVRLHSAARAYERSAARLLGRLGRMLVVYGAVLGAVAVLTLRLPTSFLPAEDQGFLIVNIQLPPGATFNRTEVVMRQVESAILSQPEVAHLFGVLGFSFSGTGQNAALAFVGLKDWGERTGSEHSAQATAKRISGATSAIHDASIFALSPPSVPDLGQASGWDFRLEDRDGMGHEALLAARRQLIDAASKDSLLSGVRAGGLEDSSQLTVDIDRAKAASLGVPFETVDSLLSTALGSDYINDFPSAGRLQRVIVQAESSSRRQAEDILRLNVLSVTGQPVSLSAFASLRWVSGPVQTVRYNGYPAMRISGDSAPGVSTGKAMEEMERLAAQLPKGFSFEWTGSAREEQSANSTAFMLMAFSLLAVFLALAALYESWSIPIAVLLIVPFGVIGALLGAWARGFDNDLYFKIGLVTIVGLSAKNAVLIIEFALDLERQGLSAAQAAIQALRLRFRPIVMTSLAFVLGVVPLAVATGAGSGSQRAIGTGVMTGMAAATLFGVLFVPIFFVVVRAAPTVVAKGLGRPLLVKAPAQLGEDQVGEPSEL